MVILIEWVVFLLALGFDHKIKRCIGSPQNVWAFFIGLFRPFGFEAQKATEIGERLLITSGRRRWDKLGYGLVEVGDDGAA